MDVSCDVLYGKKESGEAMKYLVFIHFVEIFDLLISKG